MRKRTIVKPKAVADTGSGSVQKEEYSVKVTVSMVYSYMAQVLGTPMRGLVYGQQVATAQCTLEEEISHEN